MIVAPGDVVDLAIEALAGFVPAEMVIATSDGALIEVENPAEPFPLHVPVSALGPFEFVVYASDEAGVIVWSEDIALDVQTDSPLLMLTPLNPEVVLYAYAPQRQLRMTGLFDDGITRDLSGASRGTTYLSLDEAVATVDQNGIVEARGVGSTVIVALNRGLVAEHLVTVDSYKGDWNGDGMINAEDLERFSECFSGALAEPGFAPPSGQCQDIFDFDLDGDVDCDDWTIFLERWDDPSVPSLVECQTCPGDLNSDFIVNLDDFIILAGNFGSGPGMILSDGDLNNDGFVNLDDFIILAGNFGADCN